MSLWGYYAPEEAIIRVGTKGTESYSWGDNELDFIRCSDCGCVTHYQTKVGQPNPVVAVNFGMARNEVDAIPVRYFNGAQQL